LTAASYQASERLLENRIHHSPQRNFKCKISRSIWVAPIDRGGWAQQGSTTDLEGGWAFESP